MKMHLLVKLPLFHRCCVIVSLTLFILFSLVLAKLYLGYKTTTWWIAEKRSRSITTFLKLICFSPNKRYFNDEKQHEEGKQLNTYFGVLKCFIAFLHTKMFSFHEKMFKICKNHLNQIEQYWGKSLQYHERNNKVG